ncbi:MAG: pectate lyase, partial [Prevotella sp.]|nr:pectate lyase [Prevotella sp.]
MKKVLLIAVLAIANIFVAEAQFEYSPAFPGAEGFGRYTSGGRDEDGGFSIYHVTSLEDSGPGTFRFGAATAGKKIIVFDVSGT